MTVQDLIDELNKVEDKSKIVKMYDYADSTSEYPVFIEVEEAYLNGHENSFLLA